MIHGKSRGQCSDSHSSSITRIHHFLGQLQERFPHKCPTGVEYSCRAFDVVAIFLLYTFHHSLYAFAVRNIGGYTNGFAPVFIDLIDDGIVGVGVA